MILETCTRYHISVIKTQSSKETRFERAGHEEPRGCLLSFEGNLSLSPSKAGTEFETFEILFKGLFIYLNYINQGLSKCKLKSEKTCF